MKILFLYQTVHTIDAVANWVLTLAAFAFKHQTGLLVRTCQDGYPDLQHLSPDEYPDAVLAVTATPYPPNQLDADLGDLRKLKIPYGVVHNEDWGMPQPGGFPSFAWTSRAYERLRTVYYPCYLVRQPVLPQIRRPQRREKVVLGCFGHCEPKKGILAVARWAQQRELPFVVLTPDTLEERYREYHGMVRRAGAKVFVHPWHDRVDHLNWLIDKHQISHFIFDLVPSKGGSGGSSTSARYAAAFGRPVLVVDDEPTFEADGYYVFPSLERIDPRTLLTMVPPCNAWNPDAYLEEVGRRTLAFHRGNR